MNFDRLAKVYGPLEAVTAGGKLQRCRVALLDAIPVPRRVSARTRASSSGRANGLVM